ncbi:MAG: ATP-binding protein [Alphaproteobacteria bacterium]|nr:ATP-binding protein [Alphaproteobacteria bacterium]MCB9792120.1 ATP-binding protein [Alphaproteobacteria bacterium]
MRFFNTAGPCHAAHHYMLPPERRLPQLEALVEERAFFVVHAPRQTGKTTAMQAFARRLTEERGYAALYFSCEEGRAFPEDVGAVERVLISAIEWLAPQALPEDCQPPPPPSLVPGVTLGRWLSAWAKACPRPLVLIFDEIDALAGEPLRSVLSQLRAGYVSRERSPFLHAAVLCGLKDVRDYKALSGGSDALGSASPFNIKTDSLRLGDFQEEDLRELYAQHTEETGQAFTKPALRMAWSLTRGQPWLVNALARTLTRKMAIPTSEPITAAHVAQAKDRLIAERQTHLDSLLARLREPRVQRVLEPLIAGTLLRGDSLDDDFRYCVDLGLIEPSPPPRIANAIYREIILRVLGEPIELNIAQPPRSYLDAEGAIDMRGLLEGFLTFWGQHGELLAQGLGYREAAPQLVLMAWLHRLVNGRGVDNDEAVRRAGEPGVPVVSRRGEPTRSVGDGGGSIDREVGVGRGRVDLLLRWPLPDGAVQREALEIKVWRDSDRRGDPLAEGLSQLDGYLERLGLPSGVLAIFDDRAEAPPVWERSGLRAATTPSGREVVVLRG